MADVYSAIILDDDWWDGTESWAGETSQANRDSKYSIRRYTSLSAWEADRDGNSSAGDAEIAVIIGPWTSADSALTIAGFNADIVKVRCTRTLIDGNTNPARHNGIYGGVTTAYRIESVDDGCLSIINEAFDIGGIQFKMSYSTSDTYEVALGSTSLTTTRSSIRNCIVQVDCGAGTVKYTGISMSDSDGDIVIQNCIVYGAKRRGISVNLSSGLIVNCTVSGATSVDGIKDFGGTVTVKNCAVFNNNDDFDNVGTVDHCASDDGDGTNAVHWTGGSSDWEDNFEDYANGDFTPLDDDLPDAGVGFSIDSDVPSTDIIGNSRGLITCTIGAFEYQTAGTIEPNVNDTVEITESIITSIPIGVTVSDDLSTNELIGQDLPLALSRFHSITLNELYQLLLSAVQNLSVQVFDDLSAEEFIKLVLELKPDIFSAISINELIQLFINITVNNTEHISIEDVSNLLLEIQSIVSDEITLNEFVSIIYDIVVNTITGINITELILVSLFISLLILDTITVQDLVIVLLAISLSKTEHIDINEAVQLLLPVVINVSSNLTISDTIAIETVLPDIIAASNIQISDAAEILLLGNNSISISQLLSITESLDVVLDIISQLDISTFDTVSVTETVVGSIPIQAAVFDNIVIFELVNIIFTLLCSTYDNVSIYEFVTGVLQTAGISVDDSITIAEALFTKIQLPLSTVSMISISDGTEVHLSSERNIIIGQNISLTEYVLLSLSLLPVLFATVTDSIAVTENVIVVIYRGLLKIVANAKSLNIGAATKAPVIRGKGKFLTLTATVK